MSRIQVKLCSNTAKRYWLAMAVDVEGVGNEIGTLPINARSDTLTTHFTLFAFHTTSTNFRLPPKCHSPPQSIIQCVHFSEGMFFVCFYHYKYLCSLPSPCGQMRCSWYRGGDSAVKLPEVFSGLPLRTESASHQPRHRGHVLRRPWQGSACICIELKMYVNRTVVCIWASTHTQAKGEKKILEHV